jgi:hypothetical protein
MFVEMAHSSDSTPPAKSVKMTIVDCDERPRPRGFLNLSAIRTLFSAIEVDKSLSRGASSGVLYVFLMEFGG